MAGKPNERHLSEIKVKRLNGPCESIWDSLSAYADGFSAPDEALRVEEHLAGCPDCARDLRFMRSAGVLLTQTPDLAPPSGLRQDILQATIYRRPWALRRLLESRSVGLVAGAAALGVIALIAAPPFGTSPQPQIDLPDARTAVPIARAQASESEKSGSGEIGPASPDSPSAARTGLVRAEPEHFSGAPVLSTVALRSASPTPSGRAQLRASEGRMAGKPALAPETIESPPEMGEMTPADMKMMEAMMEERNMAEAAPDSAPTPVAPDPPKVRIQLASSNNSMRAESIATLADLRKRIRRDNDLAMSTQPLFRPNEREVRVGLYRTRF